MWSPEARQKHLDKVGRPVYVYIKEEGEKMILIQIFPSTRAVGLNLGKVSSFYSNIKSRNEGWYKNKLYFSDVELENTEIKIISLLEFTQVVNELEGIRLGFAIRVTNIITGEIIVYDSMRAVSRAIGIDIKGIRNKAETSKLYKKHLSLNL